MPVTIYPAHRPTDHPAPELRREGRTSRVKLFKWTYEAEKNQRILQSSFDEILENRTGPAHNGFLEAACWAYSNHYHLQIRPEDVWFSILTQLNLYINKKNAKELRSHFVAHEGKKGVTVRTEGTIDYGELAIMMTMQMEELREWIMPDFTTTEATDKVTAAILMMGSPEDYCSYVGYDWCGIPSVTLLGTKDDWRKIRDRIEKISQFGEEAELFTKILRPVLDHLVRSFDHPQDPDILGFWGKIVHFKRNGFRPELLSGWITAFCFWSHDGTCLHTEGLAENIYDPGTQYRAGGKIDGVQFHDVPSSEIPRGFISVPIKLIDNGVEIMTRMVAGSVGIKVCTRQDLMAAVLPKATTTPSVETPEQTEQTRKKLVNQIARLREFVSRLIGLPGRDARGSTSKESPGKATAANEPQAKAVEEPAQESYTSSNPQAPQKDLEAKLDSVQPVSGWWMYELKAGRE